MPFLSLSPSRQLYYVYEPPNQAGDCTLLGRTILMVHGLGSSSSFYAPIIPHLVSRGFACLAMDSPSAGLSTIPEDSPVTIEAIAADARALLKELKIAPETVVAVGHSMGSLVVSHMAIEDGLLGVVPIGAISPGPELAAAFTQRILAVEKNGMDAMADVVPGAATATVATATHKAFIRALLLAQTPAGYIAQCRAITAAKEPDYARAKCQALFIAGGEDKVAPEAAIKKIMKKWAGKNSLATILYVGHWHCIENADGVQTLVYEFAKDVTR